MNVLSVMPNKQLTLYSIFHLPNREFDSMSAKLPTKLTQNNTSRTVTSTNMYTTSFKYKPYCAGIKVEAFSLLFTREIQWAGIKLTAEATPYHEQLRHDVHAQ